MVSRFIPGGILLFSVAGAVLGQDFFELPPIQYSETASRDQVAELVGEISWDDGESRADGGKSFLKAVLGKLKVPEESQVLVFSKTSLQNSLIAQDNPRAIYFSMDTYVGWVPGGKVEVIVEDVNLGPVFYTIDPPLGGRPARVVRATDSCLQCHATSRTSGVPGMFVRSVVPDEKSHPILSAGTSLVTDRTPLKDRWGGWYVTGSAGDPHLGNRWIHGTNLQESGLRPELSNLKDLSSLIEISKYLQPTSDIVALMVLEHQCRTHNLMTKAKMTYERAVYFQKSFSGEELTSSEGMAWKTAESSAKEIVDALLFQDEADLGGDGVEGSEQFVGMFERNGVVSESGKSLREFRLYGRLFKYRCSYMIHSRSFGALPTAVRERVFHYLRLALASESDNHLGSREKLAILELLDETVTGFRKRS